MPTQEAMVDLWKTTRQPRLREVLTLLQAREKQQRPRFRSKADLQAYYVDRAGSGDAAEGAWLAENLTVWLPGPDLVGRGDALVERLQALSERFDPRLADAALSLLHGLTGEISLHRVRGVVFPFLEDRIDPFLADSLLQLCAQVPPWAAHAYRAWLAGIEVPTPSLPPEACDAWLSELGAAGTRALDTWIERAVANPDDDGPREVLADLAIEEGDPWGTFLRLQLTGADVRAQKAWLQDHGRTWMGDLVEVTDRAWFHRGFLSGLRLAGLHAVAEERWKTLAKSPRLATVEHLEAKGTSGAQMVQFLPQLPNLRSIQADGYGILHALGQAPPPKLRSLRVSKPGMVSGVLDSLIRSCPDLEEIVVHVDGTADLLRLRHRPARCMLLHGREVHRLTEAGTVEPATLEPLPRGLLFRP